MSDKAQILFRLFWVKFDDEARGRWPVTRAFAAVLSALDDAGLRDEFELHGTNGHPNRRKRITSWDELLKNSGTWDSKPYALQTQNEEDLFFGFTFRTNQLTLALHAGGKFGGAKRNDVLERIIAFAKSISAAFGNDALLGPDFEILLPYQAYPRPRPPRMNPLGSGYGIVNFLSKRSFSRETWDVMVNADLPLGASREISGDLLTIRWVQDLDNEMLLKTQMSAVEMWGIENLDSVVDPNFNELGDHRVVAYGLRPHAPLTLYDAISRVGYKAMLQDPDGSFDEQILREINSWTLRKSLPDGTAVEEIRLILPNRDSALRLHERASRSGAAKVLYVDSAKTLWDPFPAGPWLGDP